MTSHASSDHRDPTSNPPPDAARPPRRRRRLRWVLAVGLLLIVLIAALPFLASTAAGRDAILGVVNSKVAGRFAADGMSLSWLGACELRNVTLTDLADRRVLQVDHVRTRRGLLSALASGGDIDQAQLQTVRADLHFSPDQRISLVEALSSPQARAAERPETEQTVELTTDTLQLSVVGGQVSIKSLSEIQGDRPGAAETIVTITDLETGPRSDGYHVSGKLEGRAGPLAEVTLSRPGITGDIRLACSMAFRKDSWDVELDSDLRGASYSTDNIKARDTADLKVEGAFSSSQRETTTRAVVQGTAGQAQASFSYRPSEDGGASLQDVLSAVLGGTKSALPEFAADASARLDLSKLARAFPAAMRLRPGVELTGGMLQVDDLALRGGNDASARGTLKVDQLTASADGRPIELAPVTAQVDAVMQGEQGLHFRQAQLNGRFAQIDAQGTAADLQARFNADLTDLRQHLAQVFDLGDLAFGGKLSGQLHLRHREQNQVDLDVTLAADNLDVQTAGRNIRAQRAELKHGGLLSLRDGVLQKYEARESDINLDNRLVGKFSGSYDMTSRGFRADLDLGTLDLGYVARHAVDLKLVDSVPYDAALQLKSSVARTDGKMPLVTSGELRASNLSRGGQPIAEPALRLKWSDARINLQNASFEVPKIDIEGQQVKAQLGVGYAASESDQVPAWDRLLAAALDGSAVQLPEFTISGSCQVHLPTLAQAIPGLLQSAPDTRIHNGLLQAEQLSVKGGRQPVLQGKVLLQDFSVQRGQQILNWQPWSADVDVAFEAGKGLLCRRARIRSDFAALEASGTPSDLNASFNADLAALKKELGSLLAWDDVELSGSAAGQLGVKRAGKRANVTLQATVKESSLASQGRRLALRNAELTHTGHLELDGGKLEKIVFDTLSARVDDRVMLKASGWYAPQTQTYEARFDVDKADLGLVADSARSLGFADIGPYGGTVRLAGDIRHAAADQPILSTGQAAGTNLALDQQPLSGGEVTAKWTDARLTPDLRDVKAKLLELDSRLAKLSIKEAELRLAEPVSAAGQVTADADIGGTLQTVARLAKWQSAPDLAGKLQFSGSCRTSGGVVSLAGNGGVSDMRIGSGQQALQEKNLQFNYDGEINPRDDRMTLRQFKLTSEKLSAEATGEITKLSTTRLVTLNGRYDTSWEYLTGLLHQFYPSTVDIVSVSGRNRSAFTLNGPLAAGEDRLISSQLSGEANLAWTTAEVVGLPLGEAAINAVLRDGRIPISPTKVSASQGFLNLMGTVDLTGPDPTLRVPGEHQLLERVAIDRKLTRLLLSRINPIFLQMASAEGRVSLQTQDIALPLSSAITRGGGGTGVLDLTNLTVQPGGILSELLRLGGVDAQKQHAVKVGSVDLRVKEGRITYQNFTMTFADQFDLRFFGSVGFDDTLDLTVSIPVRPALIKKIKGGSAAEGILGALADARVDIPVVGTRQKPRLDLSGIDITKLLLPKADKLPDLIDLLGGLGDKKKQKEDSGTRRRRGDGGGT